MKATIYTIIGKSWDMLDFSLNSAIENAGMPLEVIVISWSPTAEIKEYCGNRGIPLFVREDDKSKGFLWNLYDCLRMGFEKAETEIAMYVAPDNAFYKDWAANLVKHAAKDRVIFPKLIEAGILPSCHLTTNFGTTPQTFDRAAFEQFAASIAEDMLKTPEEAGIYYNHPTRGRHARPDAKPYAIFKETYWKFGGEPQGVIGGVTGDVKFIDTLIDNGIKVFQAANSIVYHFQQGERARDVNRWRR